MIALSSIRPNPDNPRNINKDKLALLKDSINEFGKMMELRPLIVDDAGIILGGNMRYRALLDLGYTEIPDSWVKRADDLTDQEKRQFIIKDNVAFGSWDMDVLANEWDPQELSDWGLDIDWEDKSETGEDNYEQPEDIETDIITGDLFQIGHHRLLCGDSTNADDVHKLLDGTVPILMVTDPPYGVNYDPSWREGADLGVGKRSTGKVQNDDRADWTEAYSLFPGQVSYVWHGGKYTDVVAKNLKECGFEIVTQIIWRKQHFAMSRGDYHWQHEPCWYAVKKGKSHNWQGDRKQTTIWDIENNNSFGNSNPEKTWGHGTQKPVRCMSIPIQNNTNNFQEVYDPFGGSGTTMVAAHQLDRKSFLMEIDPKYCQIIVDRMLHLDPSIDILKNNKKYIPNA